MPVPVLAPVVVVTATLALRGDSEVVPVYVKKPRGTMYWGGAGLDGPYVEPQLAAFRNAGISHVSVGLTNTATAYLPSMPGTILDAVRSGLALRYNSSERWTITSGMEVPAPQFNLIGYSYGSLLAAHTARSYANDGNIVDHLVLIGSPIDKDFLTYLQGVENIKKVIVIDLKEHGDPIFAGMTQLELMTSVPTLGTQMGNNKGEGHFYYAHPVPDSPRRWKELAEKIYSEGLR
ncbi:hypothetical protein NTJ56_10195 [Burkholderia contaminans]|uniref:hypothetical protein n=1 Tax=Burkholderia contaminans TaxID=488447 RepID=UPI001CF16E19|nr:hypothetical protein [Burkholderia contaminans]MCA7918749.1 hypothetical protein [Burkholderia contaminans]UUX35746.1 hypothetical protein NTJ56_10195 [Burkholderia contaminans]